MKKLMLSAILAMGLASTAIAEPLVLSGGIGIWQQNISGYVKNGNTINYFNNASAENDGNSNTGNFGLEDKKNPYVWLKIHTLIPFIPNVKFQYTRYNTSGHSDYIAGNVELFDDVDINTAIVNANTKQTINSYDITLYYTFSPAFATFNLGAGADIWKGNTKINGYEKITNNSVNIDEDWSVVLPYVYGEIQTMKIFNTSLYGNVKWAKVGDNHHYDYDGGIKYTIDIPGPVNPEIKAGYRYKEAYGVDGDNETEIKYKGFYIEIDATF